MIALLHYRLNNTATRWTRAECRCHAGSHLHGSSTGNRASVPGFSALTVSRLQWFRLICNFTATGLHSMPWHRTDNEIPKQLLRYWPSWRTLTSTCYLYASIFFTQACVQEPVAATIVYGKADTLICRPHKELWNLSRLWWKRRELTILVQKMWRGWQSSHSSPCASQDPCWYACARRALAKQGCGFVLDYR